MSSEKFQKAYELMNDKQKSTMYKLYMKGENHDGHTWNTFTDVEDAVADILSENRQNVGMLTNKEAADALVINISTWDWVANGKYQIDKENGFALVEEYTKLKAENESLKKRIECNKLLGGVYEKSM